MASIRQIAEGLSLLGSVPGSEIDDSNTICAEHDVIYAHGSKPETLLETEFQRLKELGWDWDNSLLCWRHFT